MSEVLQQVREFYDQVGWSMVGEDIYQNARFEDLRPVSREYIHRCHLRVKRHLPARGIYILDAGSGPIQYPEYLEYSREHRYRVCADISITALQEARKRIGEHGLFVVCDVTRLPFKADLFDGAVSLHTFHHLPVDQQPRAYEEIYRVLAENKTAVVVNGWDSSPLMRFFNPLIRLGFRIKGISNPERYRRILRKHRVESAERLASATNPSTLSKQDQPTGSSRFSMNGDKRKRVNERRKADGVRGTFSQHVSEDWLRKTVGVKIPVEIRVWRSISVQFMRSLIHPKIGGRYWLRLLFWLEERFPRFFGEKGLYPLIIVRKIGSG
jgi:ubiquinone/menaquinone biosynthesis C-methylase UbiE